MTRRCANPNCANELRIGQRAVYGSKETPAMFLRRRYCSFRCAQRAEGRQQYRRTKAKVR